MGMLPEAWSTNRGSTATMKMIDLAFVTPTPKPSQTVRQAPRRATGAVTASAFCLRCRIAWMPRKTM